MNDKARTIRAENDAKPKIEDPRLRVPFDLLSQGQNEVLIEYEQQIYCLRVTKNGKLILNK